MTETYGILNDIHFPYEDRTRYQVALNIFSWVHKKKKLSHIYLNGDIGEFGSVSRHPKHPTETKFLVDEFAYINKRFDELQSLFPDVPVTLIEGNHCYRIFRYIRDLAPEMWGLVDCPALLKFPDRGWKFVPYGPTQLVKCGKSNLYLRHEPLSGGGAYPTKATAEKSTVDIAFGHTHIYQIGTHRKFGPTPYTVTAYSLGFLGDRSRPVFDYRGPKENWVTGCTIVETMQDGKYNLEFVNLDKLPILFRGETFTAHPKK